MSDHLPPDVVKLLPKDGVYFKNPTQLYALTHDAITELCSNAATGTVGRRHPEGGDPMSHLHPELLALLPNGYGSDVIREISGLYPNALTHFALAVARAERERCAAAVGTGSLWVASRLRALPDPDWRITP